MNEIRIPKQKRSIETKDRIINAGMELFCTKGYYNTNTAEIAKQAGVSTGIVYSYFKDKKDIFVDAIAIYYTDLMKPIFDSLKQIRYVPSIKAFIANYIRISVIDHSKLSKNIYKEMEIMQRMDDEVEKYFNKLTNETIDQISAILIENNFPSTNLHEKMHIIFTLLESTIHEITYYSEMNGTNADTIIDCVSEIVEKLLTN